MKRLMSRLIELPFCLYAWFVTVISILIALIAVTILPSPGLRFRIAKACSRAPFVLSGCAPHIIGRENIPAGHAVMVANHASYVDGPLMKGYLPSRFSFVIKGEMRNIPVVHFLLRRSGSRFVERFEASGSARDARQIVRAAQGGQSLAFFPEGTFREEPGIGRFRAGAFMAAVKGELPIIPVAITGTRHMLTCNDWMLRRSRIVIHILPAIMPDDPAFADHRILAETARQRILAAVGEPDLLQSDAAPAELPAN